MLQDIAWNFQNILASQLRLARAEARAEFASLRTVALLMLIGTLAAMLSAGFLLLSVALLLSFVVSVWFALLIVALVMAAVAALLLVSGSRLLKRSAARSAAKLEKLEKFGRSGS